MASPLVSVTVKTEGIQQLADPNLIRNATQTMIKAAVDVFLPLARSTAPRRTGKSASGIRGIVDLIGGAWVGRVRAMGIGFPLTILAVGAKPHEISVFRPRARRGRSAPAFAEYVTTAGTVVTTRQRGNFRALRYISRGQVSFRRSVQHPGARRNPWLDRAAQTGAIPAGAAADRALSQAFANAGR